MLERNRFHQDWVREIMRKFRRFMSYLLLAGVLSFLIVPLLIPETTSGTKTNVEAAGAGAKFLELGEVSVHIEHRDFSGTIADQAATPLIVLLHGFGASTFSWREVMDPLAQYGEVLAYDRPGFGFTDRPTSWTGTDPYSFAGNFELLDGLLDAYAGDRPVVLMGHSAGGQLAAEYARQNPNRVDALVLVDAAILTTGGTPDWLGWLWDVPQIDKLGPVLVGGIASSGEEILEESYVDQNLLTPEVRAGYRAPLQVAGWERGFWNFVSAPRSNQLAENLEDLLLPALVMSGDADTIVPTSDAVRLAELLPNARLEIVTDSGHLPHEERPEAFMSQLDANLEWLFG